MSDDDSGVKTMTIRKNSEEEPASYKISRESSMYKGSEEYFEYSCDPCTSAGDHVEAHGFCSHCEEYLCGICFRSHSRSKASRDHILLDKDNMPKSSVSFCDLCKTAGDEVKAEGYCADCDERLCSTCYRSHSRSKASKHHVLLDKDNMPTGVVNGALSSSFTRMNISDQEADVQNYRKQFTYIRGINVAVTGGDKARVVTDTALMSTRLLVADDQNVSLRLGDLKNTDTKDSSRLKMLLGGPR